MSLAFSVDFFFLGLFFRGEYVGVFWLDVFIFSEFGVDDVLSELGVEATEYSKTRKINSVLFFSLFFCFCFVE